jgi:hypothetical protein
MLHNVFFDIKSLFNRLLAKLSESIFVVMLNFIRFPLLIGLQHAHKLLPASLIQSFLRLNNSQFESFACNRYLCFV